MNDFPTSLTLMQCRRKKDEDSASRLTPRASLRRGDVPHMIFISQSGITDPARDADWDEWYIEHLRIMAGVPGVSSAQRFKTDTPGHSPSLAIYTVAGAHVFDGEYYQSIRGLGEWVPLIDRRYYKRNLFDGLDEAPVVGDGEVMLVADLDRPEAPVKGVKFAWLECVGIDRSTPFRGLAVVAASQPNVARAGVAVYRPVTARVKGD